MLGDWLQGADQVQGAGQVGLEVAEGVVQGFADPHPGGEMADALRRETGDQLPEPDGVVEVSGKGDGARWCGLIGLAGEDGDLMSCLLEATRHDPADVASSPGDQHPHATRPPDGCSAISWDLHSAYEFAAQTTLRVKARYLRCVFRSPSYRPILLIGPGSA